MYIPPAFAVQDPKRLARFVAQNSFATVITQDEGGPPFASHVPILFEPEPKPGLLLGHLARANPQWRHFENQREVLVIFHGPHAYISPRWYESSPAVPTWNYAVVHAYGTPRVFTEESRLEALVRRMVKFYEGDSDNSWRGELPGDFMSKQLKAIVGFEIRLTRLEGKFKLGQNRQKADLSGVYNALSQSSRSEDHLLARFMKDEGLVD
jgi:transcriptional regulator